jgi:hypothetical protein
MSHFKEVCYECGKLVRQCRCVDHYKEITHIVCEDCKKKGE